MEKESGYCSTRDCSERRRVVEMEDHVKDIGVECSKVNFNVDEFFDFSNEDPSTLDWVNTYLAGTSSIFM